MKLTKDMVIAHDLRNTAVHEAGHVIAGLYIGMPICRALVWERRIKRYTLTRSVIGKAISYHKRSPLQNAVIGYAGVVAEAIQDFPEINADNVMYQLNERELRPSKTDWEHIHRVHQNWRFRALTRCVHILQENWSDVLLVQSSLIESFNWPRPHGRLRDGGCTITMEILSDMRQRLTREAA